MKELHFELNLTRKQALRYYEGSVRFVIVTAENGQKIQFPAQHIRPFIDQNGVEGRFAIQFDSDNKLLSLNKL
ncbi:MAG: hypothetical protein COB23_03995 [Methylophaga sp.]|nr:MAG: hypothetical protein COB23_03995 [Methylophaga sp.]